MQLYASWVIYTTAPYSRFLVFLSLVSIYFWPLTGKELLWHNCTELNASPIVWKKDEFSFHSFFPNHMHAVAFAIPVNHRGGVYMHVCMPLQVLKSVNESYCYGVSVMLRSIEQFKCVCLLLDCSFVFLIVYIYLYI